MAFLESQRNPGIVAEVDPVFQALRTSSRPLDYTTLQGKILGHYSIFQQTSAAAFTAGVNLAAFRWADPTNFAVITRVYTCLTVVTAVTAQRTDPLVLSVARAYSVRDATGATAVVVSGQNGKARSTMGSTLQGVNGNIDVTSAAGGLTAGTKTVDANPCGAAAFGPAAIAAVGTGLAITDLYNLVNSPRHPLVLASFEGVLLQWGTTTLATGTVTVGFGIDWAEVATY